MLALAFPVWWVVEELELCALDSSVPECPAHECSDPHSDFHGPEWWCSLDFDRSEAASVFHGWRSLEQEVEEAISELESVVPRSTLPRSVQSEFARTDEHDSKAADA